MSIKQISHIKFAIKRQTVTQVFSPLVNLYFCYFYWFVLFFKEACTVIVSLWLIINASWLLFCASLSLRQAVFCNQIRNLVCFRVAFDSFASTNPSQILTARREILWTNITISDELCCFFGQILDDFFK